MKSYERILLSCCNFESSLSEITDMLGWKGSAAASLIKKQVEKGFLMNTRYGCYFLTKKGREFVKEFLKNMFCPFCDIDYIAYRTAEVFISPSRFGIVKTLQYERKPLVPTGATKELGDVFKKIYLESVGKQNPDCVDNGHVKSAWRSHSSYECEKCGFNFEKAYEKYENDLYKIETIREIEKDKIFKNLRWESYPDIEKYRKNFGLKTNFDGIEVPDHWKY